MKRTSFLTTLMATLMVGSAWAATYNVPSSKHSTWHVGKYYTGYELVEYSVTSNGNTYIVASGGTLEDNSNPSTAKRTYATLNNGAFFKESVASPIDGRCDLTLSSEATVEFLINLGTSTGTFNSTITGAGTAGTLLITAADTSAGQYTFTKAVTNVNVTTDGNTPELVFSDGGTSLTSLQLGSNDVWVGFTGSTATVGSASGKGTLEFTGATKLTLNGMELSAYDTGNDGVISNSGTGSFGLDNAEVTFTNINMTDISGTINATLVNCGVTVSDSAASVSFNGNITLSDLDAKNKAVVFDKDSTVSVTELKNAAELTADENAKVSFAQSEITVNKVTLQAGSTVTLNDHAGSLTTSTLNLEGNSTLNANLVLTDGSRMVLAQGAQLAMGCTITLNGTASFTISADDRVTEENFVTLATSVEDIKDAAGNSITLSGSGWTQSEGADKWYIGVTESYDAATETYTYTTGTSTDGKVLVYDLTDRSNGKLMLTPEPATATLSLLALAGLAARRRRLR